MAVRGIRGATTADENSRQAILEATKDLLQAILVANDLALEDVASALFTVTADLDATFPALAARQIGWDLVPLTCAREIDVPGSLRGCVRVLLHVNTDRPAAEIRHVYLKGAERLRESVANDLA